MLKVERACANTESRKGKCVSLLRQSEQVSMLVASMVVRVSCSAKVFLIFSSLVKL